MKKQYFCNPLNMDYRYQFIQDMRSGEDKISREAADPSMILFQGKYYIFASMTLSVWVSEDMVHWESHRLPDSLPRHIDLRCRLLCFRADYRKRLDKNQRKHVHLFRH